MVVVSADELRSYLKRVESGIRAAARQALGQAAAYAAEHARRTTKFKDGTGKLRKSINRGAKGEWALFVQASAKHALWVEEDTKAHEIRPKLSAGVSGPVRPSQSRRSRGAARQFLRFVVGGRTVFARSVRHPGTTGTHFMRDARDAAEAHLFRFVEIGINEVVKH